MVNSVHSSAEWQPRFAPHGLKQQALKQQAQSEAFELSSENLPKKDDGFAAFGDDGFTLLDAVDIVNPLQHLPLVGTLYREITGDTLDPFSRVAGSTLFFGPLGTAVSGVNVAMKEFTGKDMGGHMMAFFKDAEAPAQETDIAQRPAGEKSPAEASKPAAAGTDGLDPVTAWALAELNYRNSEAEKRGLVLPDRPYSALVANAATRSQAVEPVKVVPPTQWARPDVAATLSAAAPKAVAEPVLEETIKTLANEQTKPPVEQSALPLNEFQAVHRASPATLLRLKQTTSAYQTIDFPSVPSSDQPEKQSSAQETKEGREFTNSGSLFVSDRAPSSKPAPQNSNWLSASMIEALGKYKQAETTDKSQLDQLTSKSSLH